MAKLEFLANMNISPLTVRQLRAQGWNITRVSEVMEKGSKDIDILTYAQKQNKIVITQDLDFSTLLALRGYTKPSVINLRLENPRPGFVSERVLDVVSMMEKELQEGVIITIDETTARYRNLPIRLE